MKTTARSVLACIALSFVALVTPVTADAKPFATDKFSMELGEAPVCFAIPTSLHDATSCHGLPPLRASDIDNTQIGLISAGGIRRASHEPEAAPSGPIIGLLQMFRRPVALAVHPEAAVAERIAVDATKALLADLPREALRGRPVPRIESVDGLVVVRTSVDVEGLPAGTRAAFFAHIETATVFGRDATYTVVWSGPSDSTTALARLADDATKTLRLVPDQHPAKRDAAIASVERFAKTLWPLGTVAVVATLAGVLFLRKRRGKNRLAAELWPADRSNS